MKVPPEPASIKNFAFPNDLLPEEIIPSYFKSWRGKNQEQKRAVEAVLTHVFESNKPFLFIQAPTGSGKSLIAIASAILIRNKFLSNASSIDDIPHVLIFSENTFLIEQYGRDFNVPTLNGRKNYVCPYLSSQGKQGVVEDCPFLSSGGSYADCPLMNKFLQQFHIDSSKKIPQPDVLANDDEKSEKASISLSKIPSSAVNEIPCPYLRARERARRAGIAVMNYHYAHVVFTLRQKYPALRKMWKYPLVVIIDEAHKFPDFLMSVFEESLNIDRLLKTTSHYLSSKNVAKTKESINALFDVISTFLKSKWGLEIYFKDEKILDYYDKMISSFKELNSYNPSDLKKLLEKYHPLVPSTGENYAISLQVGEAIIQEIQPFVKNLYELIINIQQFTWTALNGIEDYITRNKQNVSEVGGVLKFIQKAKKTLNSNSYSALIEILSDEDAWDELNEVLFKISLSHKVKDPSIANEVVDVIYYAYEIFTAMFHDFLMAGSPTSIKQAYSFLERFNNNKEFIVPHPDKDEDVLSKEKDIILTFTKNSKGDLVLNLKIIFPQRAFREFWELLGRPKIVFMSATLLESLMREILGLSKEEYSFFKIPSEFHAKNRPIYYLPLDYISRKNLKNRGFIQYYINLIDKLLQKFQSYRGLILVPSIKDINILKTKSMWAKRLIPVWGGTIEKTRALKLLKSTSNGVLVGPSVWEGVDLKGDLSRFQIIFKVPFASLGDYVVRIRMKRSPTWYRATALLQTIQGCGRSIRSKSDYAITIIMDKAFGTLLKEFYDEIPDWFLEATLVYWPAKKEYVSLKSLDWLIKKKKAYWILYSNKNFKSAFELLLREIEEFFSTSQAPDEASPSGGDPASEGVSLSTPLEHTSEPT